ncbi:MAG: aldehyde dehydrogenase family protein [Actinomycetes bacterium]
MRLDVKKTYKLYIGGAFPRSESGRVYSINDADGEFLANPSQASRKDLRDAVVSARSAVSGWSSATAYNRGQILYRVAELMEGRSSQFIDEIQALEGATAKSAKAQVNTAIDCWVWYAGWCDKIASVSGSTNSVSGPYYNFTVPENLGVVGVIAEQENSLIGAIAGLASVLAGGNTAIVVASENYPLPAISLAEVLATSDVPAGVVNILTGVTAELFPWLASHMDIDGLDISGLTADQEVQARTSGAENLKRIHRFEEYQSLRRIQSFMENKTVWHPIGV